MEHFADGTTLTFGAEINGQLGVIENVLSQLEAHPWSHPPIDAATQAAKCAYEMVFDYLRQGYQAPKKSRAVG